MWPREVALALCPFPSKSACRAWPIWLRHASAHKHKGAVPDPSACFPPMFLVVCRCQSRSSRREVLHGLTSQLTDLDAFGIQDLANGAWALAKLQQDAALGVSSANLVWLSHGLHLRNGLKQYHNCSTRCLLPPAFISARFPQARYLSAGGPVWAQ